MGSVQYEVGKIGLLKMVGEKNFHLPLSYNHQELFQSSEFYP